MHFGFDSLLIDNLKNGPKGKGLVCGEIGHDLSVEADVGCPPMADEIGVAPRILTDASLYTLDPKLVPLALLSLPIAISVLP